ncbi:hypothetical protein [Actinoalloteichus hymeniacidonis]|uniref:Uncharacterized protein n=1 Tax=Actinoalloteichus hymeniacidonis TaxID=340345 RepID=A0AAC9MZZ4_9PSEU|nr:hypothetical protein [Actinoalloteichus hymeniacidonis]AOS64441.1 hypothetical protein TL08_18230 [Actinoalloteichus hymeniacidonis]MBB5907489.1 hypothetical protein [Actinoalloteichus hymeniacidonis]
MDRRIGGKGGGSDKGGGTLVAAIVLAIGTAAAGGATLGGGAALSGAGGPGQVRMAEGVTDSLAGESLGVRTQQGKRAARRGDADGAWNRLGVRALRQRVERGAECAAASFGQVQTFFLRTPCRSLDRMLLAVGDGKGNDVLVSVAWVGFRDRSTAREFTEVIDVHGSGDIRPLAGGLTNFADVAFTGHHYHSEIRGEHVTIAETERLGGHLDAGLLQSVAEVASMLPRP